MSFRIRSSISKTCSTPRSSSSSRSKIFNSRSLRTNRLLSKPNPNSSSPPLVYPLLRVTTKGLPYLGIILPLLSPDLLSKLRRHLHRIRGRLLSRLGTEFLLVCPLEASRAPRTTSRSHRNSNMVCLLATKPLRTQNSTTTTSSSKPLSSSRLSKDRHQHYLNPTRDSRPLPRPRQKQQDKRRQSQRSRHKRPRLRELKKKENIRRRWLSSSRSSRRKRWSSRNSMMLRESESRERGS